MKCVVVSGATGFIGRKVVHRLRSGGTRVVAIVRPSSDLRCLDAVDDPGIEVVVHDGDTAALVATLRRRSIDALAHLATHFVVEHRLQDIEPMIAANVLFGAQLAEAVSTAGGGTIVNVVTPWQHDGIGSQPYAPLNLYAATKQACEDILAYYARDRGLRVLHLEMCDTYGPGDTRRKVIPALLAASARDEVIHMSPGEQRLDLVHVDDAANAIVLALQHARTMPAGETARFSVTSGTRIELREVVRLLSQCVGRPIPVAWGSRPYRSREVMTPRATYSPLPDWEPSIPLASGLITLKTVS